MNITKEKLFKLFSVGDLVQNPYYTENIGQRAEAMDRRENSQPEVIVAWSGRCSLLKKILNLRKEKIWLIKMILKKSLITKKNH